MIKPEDVPEVVVIAAWEVFEREMATSRTTTCIAIAAALNAWPGASEENRQLQSWNAQGGIDTKWRKHIILHLGDSK